MKKKKETSMVLGFCKCSQCENTHFYWTTFFICKDCGCKTFEKWKDPMSKEYIERNIELYAKE